MLVKEMKTLTIGGIQYKITDENVGAMEQLNTTQKSSLVAAINELSTSKGIGENQINELIKNYIEQTKISVFENDVGYLTEHQSLKGLATEAYVNTQIAAIPTPDVSGQIHAHNLDANSHTDIRSDVTALKEQSNLIFTNWSVAELEESGDITKKYVLADNYIYLYNSSESNITNFADPESNEWLSGKRVNSSKEVVDVSDPNQKLTNMIPLGGSNQFHIKGMNVYDAMVGTSNYCRVILYNSSKEIIAFAQLTTANFISCHSIANYDTNVSIVDVPLVIEILKRSYVIDDPAYVRFGGYTTNSKDVIITRDANIPAKNIRIRYMG